MGVGSEMDLNYGVSQSNGAEPRRGRNISAVILPSPRIKPVPIGSFCSCRPPTISISPASHQHHHHPPTHSFRISSLRSPSARLLLLFPRGVRTSEEGSRRAAAAFVASSCPHSPAGRIFRIGISRQEQEGNTLGNAERCACTLTSYLVRELAG